MTSRKSAAILAAVALLTATPGDISAVYVSDAGGVGYQRSWTLPSLTPYIALGTVAAVAIAVMAIRHHHHSHD